jgi:phospholipid-binding lipoprotein MlaA
MSGMRARRLTEGAHVHPLAAEANTIQQDWRKKASGRRTSVRARSILFFLLVFPVAGCAHNPNRVSSPSAPPPSFRPRIILATSDFKQPAMQFPGASWVPVNGPIPYNQNAGDPETVRAQSGPSLEGTAESASEEMGEEKEVTIADPLEPFNRAMFQFNDKLYFWVLKPVAQGYNKVVPEPARIGVKNFFYNLKFPLRFLSCLLQANLSCAGTEAERFAVNTLWGVGGLLDPASREKLDIPKNNVDLGQTLGLYGLGQGFYIVWPFLGPYSARDSVQIPANFFVYPINYIRPWYDWLAVRSYEEVNDTSLVIGDYEALVEAAIDPYVALRNAYAQYRQGLVEAAKRKSKAAPPRPGGVKLGD